MENVFIVLCALILLWVGYRIYYDAFVEDWSNIDRQISE